jgi:predicted porin
VLLFGGSGRLEIGERMGLPDVLTGYAPNNFQFTSAEFGPASGPSLDPAGRLQAAFLPEALAAQLDSLIALGGTAALFDDQSTKLLYVSPKKDGWLAGVSYAPDADDETVERLLQAGLTHESYWQQNVLRWGVTYAAGRASRDRDSARDLKSVGAGVSITFDDALTLGLSASYDGRSRASSTASGAFASAAWGGIASVNYNTGPWTIGAYYQHASAEGSSLSARDDRLSAFEAGASYRFTTKVRLYGAWYRFKFDDDDRSVCGLSATGDVFMLGLRFTL